MAESRRTVTVVFADVSGSTALGEALDPEALRGVLARYFDALRTALEHHDGFVEKYIGDAVMAVFGLSAIHEDDALRAVRAAAEARERLLRLNSETEAELGVALAARVGVNTGEVVAGEGDERQQLVTGDAVNVAARLEQAARPGEILLGAETLRLVRDAVRVDEVEPLELKGKAEPVAAFRLVEVLPDVPAYMRRLDAPFVGRRFELAELSAAFDRCVAEHACEQVTVLGEPGIGKSRLVRELVNKVGERGRVLVGRCLPYGEGITYWPLAEIVAQVAGSDVRTGLVAVTSGETDGELVAGTISAGIGGGDEASSTEDTHWAVRRLLETLGREGPVVVIVDDLHWAEPTMLDLVEYVTVFAEGPILLVGVARPEVVEARPTLGMPGPRSTVVRLAPLPAEEAEQLVTALGADAAVSPTRRERILERAEGNPLFVEQMLAMDAESSDEIEVPPTIQALLAARIDRLEPGERVVIQCGAVEGRLFHRHAVMELAPEDLRPAVGTHLLALVRKQLARPDRALFPGDDGFRFAHILVRDAAYAAASKETRAALHERYAAWLEGVSGGASETSEIVAYHLEQAARFSAQLGRPNRGLEARAGGRLGEAGIRALERGDIPAAINLIERARQLLRHEPAERARFGLRLTDAYLESGRLAEAEALSEELVAAAADGNDEVLSVAVGVERMLCLLQVPKITAEEAIAAAHAALPVLEESGDDVALGRAWSLIVHGHLLVAQYGPVEAAAERALEAARRSRDFHTEREVLFWLTAAQLFGPTPAEEGLAKCERVVPDPQERVTIAHKLYWRGGLNAFAGRPDGVRELEEAREIYRDLGLTLRWAGTAIVDGIGNLAVGEAERAEQVLRESLEALEQMGEKGYLSSIAYYLADALLRQGRFEEAEELTRVSEATTAPDDIASLVGWRRTRALVLAERGEFDEAELLLGEALELASRSDSLMQTAEVALALATMHEKMSRTDQATAEAQRAADLFARKGMETSAARAKALIVSL